MGITYCSHPLLQHHLAILRNQDTNDELFRNTVRRVSQFILYEATKTLPLTKVQIETPLATTEQNKLADSPIIIVPILRAGLGMGDVLLELIPEASLYHLGLYRDERSLNPITYYNKLSDHIDYKAARIFIVDPMLATGGSINSAVSIFRKLGALEKNITVACLIASPEGIAKVQTENPDVNLFVGALDQELTKKGFIYPGLGDAGDRYFST